MTLLCKFLKANVYPDTLRRSVCDLYTDGWIYFTDPQVKCTLNDAETAIHTTVWKVASLCNITLINSAIHHYPSLPCRPFLSDPSVCDGTWKRLPARQISRVGAFGCPSLITHSGPGGGLRRCRRTEGSSERCHHPHTSARHNRERKLCTLKVQQNVSCAV